jgi:hypothetical protein
MTRILKPGPRPYRALGMVFGALVMLATFPVFKAGKPWQAVQAGGATLVVYAAACLAISRQRVVVQSDSVAFQELFKPANRVYFADISKSVAKALAEPEHPVALYIYTHNAKKPALRLRLKSFRQADVAWLVSVPELRVGPTQSLHLAPR